MLKDLARALSLANLWFIVVWAKLIGVSLNPAAQWARYSFSGYLAVMLNVLALAAAFWIAMTLARRSGSSAALSLARWAFLLALVGVAYGLLQTQIPGFQITASALLASKKRIALTILIAAFGLFLVVRFRQHLVRAGAVIILVLSPFALITFGQAVWMLALFKDKPAAPLLEVKDRQAPRILWLVFDEMDQRLAFTERPDSLKLPELDRLRRQAIFATNAHPPANGTLRSMPALITGRLVADTRPAGPSERLLVFADSKEAVGWSAQPNVFSRAREAGFNTALVGWYHPYCRIIGSSLTVCSYRDTKNLSLSESMTGQLKMLALTSPVGLLEPLIFKGRGTKDEGKRKDALNLYLNILEDAKRVATDSRLGLSLVHWSVPHLPVIYNRRIGDFKWNKECNYLDNLALADRALGEVRQAMEAAGVWESTTVLVTSDHPLKIKRWANKFPHIPAEDAAAIGRGLDPRIPFVLKLAGQQESMTYAPAFNTVLTHDLFLALLRGEIMTPQDVVSWLEKHPFDAESLNHSKEVE